MDTPREQPEEAERLDPKTEEGEFSLRDFLAASGVTEQQMMAVLAQLTALVPKLLDEVIKESWRYAKEDKDLLAFKKLHMTEMREMTVMSANSSRSFLLALTTLSITVIGALFAKSDSEMLRGNLLVLSGCALLAISVIVSVSHLSYAHVYEHDTLKTISWKQRKQVFELRKLLRNMHDKSQPFDAYSAAKSPKMAEYEEDEAAVYKTMPKTGGLFRAMHIASAAFLIGLVLVAAGFLMR